MPRGLPNFMPGVPVTRKKDGVAEYSTLDHIVIGYPVGAGTGYVRLAEHFNFQGDV